MFYYVLDFIALCNNRCNEHVKCFSNKEQMSESVSAFYFCAETMS